MNNDELQKHVMSGRVKLSPNSDNDYLYRAPAPRIECRDGFSFSVQASAHHYCRPRAVMTWPSLETYTAFEVGFPSQEEELLMRYAEDQSKPTETVYGYVPVDTVLMVIAKHGGKI